MRAFMLTLFWIGLITGFVFVLLPCLTTTDLLAKHITISYLYSPILFAFLFFALSFLLFFGLLYKRNFSSSKEREDVLDIFVSGETILVIVFILIPFLTMKVSDGGSTALSIKYLYENAIDILHENPPMNKTYCLSEEWKCVPECSINICITKIKETENNVFYKLEYSPSYVIEVLDKLSDDITFFDNMASVPKKNISFIKEWKELKEKTKNHLNKEKEWLKKNLVILGYIQENLKEFSKELKESKTTFYKFPEGSYWIKKGNALYFYFLNIDIDFEHRKMKLNGEEIHINPAAYLKHKNEFENLIQDYAKELSNISGLPFKTLKEKNNLHVVLKIKIE